MFDMSTIPPRGHIVHSLVLLILSLIRVHISAIHIPNCECLYFLRNRQLGIPNGQDIPYSHVVLPKFSKYAARQSSFSSTTSPSKAEAFCLARTRI
jgi:hypothetical protein